jgi:ribosomal protein S18 acetylase RimI-like enzyme
MTEVVELKASSDFVTAAHVVALYEAAHPVAPMAPVVHEVLTGRGLFRMFMLFGRIGVAKKLVGAAVLKSPEMAFPIGADVQPLAWVISDVVVHPTCRGHGFAMVLLAALEREVVATGGRIIYLYTEATNVPALRLYEKAGFVRLKDQSDKAVFVKTVVG